MDHPSRRSVLSWSLAGMAAMRGSASLAEAGPRCGPSSDPATSKHSWTLSAPAGGNRAAFRDFVLRDLAKRAAERLAGVIYASITLQQPDAFSSAFVDLGRVQAAVDAVLEITSSQPSPALDEVHAYLVANTGFAQGWRVHPTMIFDASRPLAPGARSDRVQGHFFARRLDGTSRAHFDREWYVHAGHLDGLEAESVQSRAIAARRAAASPGLRYVQNRMVEPVTPTAWVIDGYASLYAQHAFPKIGERIAPRNGEAMFDEWPPRLVQGYEYRIV